MIDVAVIAPQQEVGVGHGTITKNLQFFIKSAEKHEIRLRIYNMRPFFEFKMRGKVFFGFVTIWPRVFLLRPEAKILHAIDPYLALPNTEVVTLLDLAPKRFPESYAGNAFAPLMWKYWENRLRDAKTLASISQFSKKEAMDMLGIPGDRIKVIHLGLNHDMFFVDKSGSKWRQPGKINIVTTANTHPRKNFPLLVEAAGILQENGKEVNLVRFGRSDWTDEAEKIRKIAKKWKVKIVEPGVVSVEDLRKAYSTFDVFVWPSIYEGMGLPPLEAMACGAKVVALDTEFNREFLGDVPVYVKNDPREMAEGILEALKKDIGQRGIEQAKKFTWEKWADEHIQLYKTILGEV